MTFRLPPAPATTPAAARLALLATLATLATLMAAAPLGAQRAGTLEVGAFLQQIDAADRLALHNGVGAGARFGVFLDERWELEGELTVARLDARLPRALTGQVDLRTQMLRANYGVPFGALGRTHEFYLGAGGGRVEVGTQRDWALSGAGGLRLRTVRWLAVRLDVAADVAPSTDPDPLRGETSSGRYTNWMARAGVSVLFDVLPPAAWRALPPRR